MKSYIYGLGGRDITVQHICDIVEKVEASGPEDELVTYFGVRE